MYLKAFQLFIEANIYLLLLVNAIIVIAIYVLILITSLRKKKYDRTKMELTPIITSYMENTNTVNEAKSLISTDYKKLVAIDIIYEMSKEQNQDMSNILIGLGLDLFFIPRVKKKPSITNIRKLAFMKVPSAYEVLLKNTASENLDIQYISYYGLSILNIDKIKKYRMILQLINTDINSDRIIEILNKCNFMMEDWMILLRQEKKERGKIILLKIIANLEEIKTEEYSDEVRAYLDDVKEVKIAAIAALCSSKNEKYIEELFAIYQKEASWEVRSAITKGMTNYSANVSKDKLLVMIKDKEWWVRFNAARAISLLGEEGIFMLIDLSVDKSDENIAALAYYFLNSNKDIYETVNKIEG